jgi:hypothetical protein
MVIGPGGTRGNTGQPARFAGLRWGALRRDGLACGRRLLWLVPGLVVALSAGCFMSRPSSKPVTLADDWELAGPFKVFSRKKPVRGKKKRAPKPTRRPTTAPTAGSPPAIPETALDHFDGSFDLAGIPPGLFASVPHEDDTPWYLDIGFRTGYTRLESASDRLSLRLDLPMKLDVFGIFDPPFTPLDRKSQMALTTQYIGLGRRETDWLTWNFYFGSGVGVDRDKQRWLTANLDVKFQYALFYTGLTTDIYPWGIPKYRNYPNYRERLKASRPYAVTGFEMGYLRARGWGDFKIAPLRLYADSQRIEDWLFSWLIGLGWEFPLNDRWAFNFSGHYTFHFYRPEEYNGYNMVFAFRYRF